MAGARLKSACYRVAPSTADGPFGAGRSVATLAIGHISSLPRLAGLAALLAGLLPRGAGAGMALDCLLLQHCALEPRSALERCTQLAALPALQLHFCTGDGSGTGVLPGGRCLGSALAPLLAQASSLTALELQGRLTAAFGPGVLPSLPAELAAKSGLRWLRLRQNYLERLPPGAWLQGALLLPRGPAGCARPARTAAGACVAPASAGRAGESDQYHTPACRPSLRSRRLAIHSWPTAALEVLDIGDVNLAASRALPHGLAGAPALRRLCLATNSKVVVSALRGAACAGTAGFGAERAAGGAGGSSGGTRPGPLLRPPAAAGCRCARVQARPSLLAPPPCPAPLPCCPPTAPSGAQGGPGPAAVAAPPAPPLAGRAHGAQREPGADDAGAQPAPGAAVKGWRAAGRGGGAAAGAAGQPLFVSACSRMQRWPAMRSCC